LFTLQPSVKHFEEFLWVSFKFLFFRAIEVQEPVRGFRGGLFLANYSTLRLRRACDLPRLFFEQLVSLSAFLFTIRPSVKHFEEFTWVSFKFPDSATNGNDG